MKVQYAISIECGEESCNSETGVACEFLKADEKVRGMTLVSCQLFDNAPYKSYRMLENGEPVRHFLCKRLAKQLAKAN